MSRFVDDAGTYEVREGQKVYLRQVPDGGPALNGNGADGHQKARWNALRAGRPIVLDPTGAECFVSDDGEATFVGDVCGCPLPPLHEVDRCPGRGDGDDPRRVIGRRASTVVPAPVRWAYAERVPLAACTLLAGREGVGKGAFAAHLAARWSRGQLDGDLHGQPVDVGIASIEDDPERVMTPRLMAAGADLDRCHFLEARVDGLEAPLALPEDVGSAAGLARPDRRQGAHHRRSQRLHGREVRLPQGTTTYGGPWPDRSPCWPAASTWPWSLSSTSTGACPPWCSTASPAPSA